MTPVQFDLHGSPLFQFLRLFIGSIKLPLIALRAFAACKTGDINVQQDNIDIWCGDINVHQDNIDIWCQ
jgi:hypothetical protein